MNLLPIYQVDAFADAIFKGNPACVMALPSWLPDETLLSMAVEHNQSETAYIVPVQDDAHDYELRWFTPTREVDLCGHATLASAFVIFNYLGHAANTVRFKTRFAGDLSVRRDGDLLELNFPARRGEPAADDVGFLNMLNVPAAPIATFRTARDIYFVFNDEAAIRAASPDMQALSRHMTWPCITAPGKDCDFVSRFFTAGDGLDEDPVTGSTHCTLAPYWGERLGKTHMKARQLSQRGGKLDITLDGDRVRIAGRAVLYMQGQISLKL